MQIGGEGHTANSMRMLFFFLPFFLVRTVRRVRSEGRAIERQLKHK